MRTSPLKGMDIRRLQLDAIDITSDLHKCAGLIEPAHHFLDKGEERPSTVRVTSPQEGLEPQCNLRAAQVILARLTRQEERKVIESAVSGLIPNPLTDLVQIHIPLIAGETVT